MRARTYATVQCARESIGRQISPIAPSSKPERVWPASVLLEMFHERCEDGGFHKTFPLRSNCYDKCGRPRRRARPPMIERPPRSSPRLSYRTSSAPGSRPSRQRVNRGRANQPENTKRPHPRVPFRPLESLQTSLRGAAVYATGCAMPMSLSRFLLSAA